MKNKDRKQNKSILLIEDEVNVAGFIKLGLEENNYNVDHLPDGREAINLIRENKYDLIILDVILPGLSGWEILQFIRKELQLKVPVLMLTALRQTDHVVQGLEMGADDYIGKPFAFKELLARVNALIRRDNQNQNNFTLLKYDDLELDINGKIATRDGKKIRLTRKEFNLLKFMMEYPDQVLERKAILREVWKIDFDLETNVLDVYINYLRNKIDKPFNQKLIHTAIGIGYILSNTYDHT